MKRLFKWALYLFLFVVVLLVAAVLLLNTIVKEFVQRRLRSETGMDVRIGKIDIGLATPTIAIENFKIYNSPQFGGSPFLDIPEIFVEYDRDAIRAGKLHLKLVRVDLAEIDIVQDKDGRLNILSIKEKSDTAKAALAGQSSKMEFTGIDTLNLTFQRLRVSNLAAPAEAEEVDFGLTNQVFTNIQSEKDLDGLAVVMAGRAGAAASSGKSPMDLQKLLLQLLH
ncbi:MAG: hypothetical protein ABSA47_09870 [Verrucomicrobiota bacterium]|jgi:uncharacterized protein involved in outer membrane biogenesis